MAKKDHAELREAHYSMAQPGLIFYYLYMVSEVKPLYETGCLTAADPVYYSLY